MAVKGLHRDAQHMCDPIVGLVRDVRVAVDESNNVRFRVVGVMIVPWQGR